MGDPRKVVSYEGLFAGYATFKHDTSIVFDSTLEGGAAQVGKAVQLTDAAKVGLTVDGSDVVGKLIKVEGDGFCTVQVEGYCTLPGGNGATLTVGKKLVGAVNAESAGGYIREVNTATAAELGLCTGKIIDASTATAVIVAL